MPGRAYSAAKEDRVKIRISLICMLFLVFSGCAGGSDDNPEPNTDLGTTGDDVSADVAESNPDVDEPDIPSEPEIDEADTQTAAEIDEPEPEYGSMEGRLVNVQGQGVGLAYLLICDAGGCTSAQADPDGEFFVEEMNVGPYKVQVVAEELGYMNMEYPLTVELNKTVSAGEDIVLVARQDDPVAWDPEKGGTVVLADGKLSLTVVPGDLKFPLGMKKELWAADVPVEYLPPFPNETWTNDSEVYAFHINPLGVYSQGASFDFEITANEDSTATTFTVWFIHVDTGMLVEAGTVSKNDSGQIASGGDLEFHELATLVLVGQEASQ
jgi:hypothetical protein